METNDLKSVFDELISVYQNIKAEVIVAEVQESSENEVDFLIKNKSSFSRSYRRDVINVEVLDELDLIALNLSRNGIYDSLPEGLFHSKKDSKKTLSYAAKRKKYKEEENDARSFFGPIENEFFNQRLNIEKNERVLLENFYSLKDDFLVDFWKINKEIPKAFILKLIKILPFSFKIAGDLELSRLCLQKILDENITFKKKFDSKSSSEENEYNELGVNFITHSKETKVFHPYLEVEIGPVEEDRINEYLKKDGILKFINTFYDYFMPLELEVVTKFIVNNKEGFVISDANNPLVGISTRI